MGITNCKSSGNIGDTIAGTPSMLEYYEKTGNKICLYLNIGIPAFYYENAQHPVKDSAGIQVMLNQTIVDMAKPLFMHQEYIEDVRIWKGEKIDIDFDEMRNTFVGMPVGDLRKWVTYVYPDLQRDLSKPYLTVPDTDESSGKILVNRTFRYNNPMISYFFLKEYGDNVWFVGMPEEHEKFCKDFDLNIPHRQVVDFLELASLIKCCKVFLGGQSMAFQIAQGLLSPRVLEVCQYAQNVLITGPNGYDYFSQKGLEYYVDYLFNI